jgi:uncharacterized caspase-like protein
MICFRSVTRSVGLLLLLAGTFVSSHAGPNSRVWLEIPSQHLRVEANEAAILTPGAIPLLNVHLGRQPQDVAYSKVTTRLNTEVANVVSTQHASDEGIICTLDLSRNPSFALRPGRNSVEVTYKDRWNEVHYTSFMLQLPAEKSESPLGRPPAPPRERPFAGSRRFALVIGVAKYKLGGRGLENLPYADSDAETFHNFLIHGGGTPSENVRMLLNEDATLDNVKQALSEFLAAVKQNDTVILYLNMHGAYDPADPDHKYLLTYDSDPRDMADTALSVADLQNLLSSSVNSKHVVLLADTCHGNGIGVDVTVKTRPDNLVNLYLSRALQLLGIASIEASDIHQLSRAGGQWNGAGVFTHYLVEGLAGKADTDGDGIVTASELFTYVQLQVTKDTFDEQLPIAEEGHSGNVALAGVMTSGRNASSTASAR